MYLINNRKQIMDILSDSGLMPIGKRLPNDLGIQIKMRHPGYLGVCVCLYDTGRVVLQGKEGKEKAYVEELLRFRIGK